MLKKSSCQHLISKYQAKFNVSSFIIYNDDVSSFIWLYTFLFDFRYFGEFYGIRKALKYLVFLILVWQNIITYILNLN